MNAPLTGLHGLDVEAERERLLAQLRVEAARTRLLLAEIEAHGIELRHGLISISQAQGFLNALDGDDDEEGTR